MAGVHASGDDTGANKGFFAIGGGRTAHVAFHRRKRWLASRRPGTMREFCPVAGVPAHSVAGMKLAATTYLVSLRESVVHCLKADPSIIWTDCKEAKRLS